MPQINFAGQVFNTVTVHGRFITNLTAPQPASGQLYFDPTDISWSDALGICALEGTIGATLDSTGGFSVDLFACDNALVSGTFAWRMTGTISGRTLRPRHFTINHADGDTQSLTSLLPGVLE